MDMPPGAVWHLEVFITPLFSGYLMLGVGLNQTYLLPNIQHPVSGYLEVNIFVNSNYNRKI